MLKIKVRGIKFDFGVQEVPVEKGMTVRKYWISKTVEIPSWQLHIFREKQIENPRFNSDLQLSLGLKIAFPYVLIVLNTAIRTRGCKNCGRFVIGYQSSSFPTEDKFVALNQEVRKALEFLRSRAND